MDLLRADRLALAAADAGGGFFVLVHDRIARDDVEAFRDGQVVGNAQQSGDVEPHRAAGAAVAAGGAGDHARQTRGRLVQHSQLRLVQRLILGEGFEVVLHLRQIRHAAEDHRRPRHGAQPAEGPGGRRLLRTQRAHLFLDLRRKFCQLAAAHRLHHPHRDAVRAQQIDLLLRVLQLPVHIVQLDLAEFELLAVVIQKARQSVRRRVAGKAQVADAALRLLLLEIGQALVDLLPVIMGQRVFADVVQQVEVEILHPALFQLILKNLLRHHGLDALDVLVAGELVRQVPALARIAPQGCADRVLRFAAVVGVGRIEIVDAGGHGRVHHPVQLRLIDRAVRPERQAHCAEAERRQFFPLKFVVQHGKPSRLFSAFIVHDETARIKRHLTGRNLDLWPDL